MSYSSPTAVEHSSSSTPVSYIPYSEPVGQGYADAYKFYGGNVTYWSKSQGKMFEKVMKHYKKNSSAMVVFDVIFNMGNISKGVSLLSPRVISTLCA